MYVCAHIHVRTCVRIRTQAQIHTHTHTHKHTNTHACIRIHVRYTDSISYLYYYVNFLLLYFRGIPNLTPPPPPKIHNKNNNKLTLWDRNIRYVDDFNCIRNTERHIRTYVRNIICSKNNYENYEKLQHFPQHLYVAIHQYV